MSCERPRHLVLDRHEHGIAGEASPIQGWNHRIPSASRHQSGLTQPGRTCGDAFPRDGIDVKHNQRPIRLSSRHVGEVTPSTLEVTPSTLASAHAHIRG